MAGIDVRFPESWVATPQIEMSRNPLVERDLSSHSRAAGQDVYLLECEVGGGSQGEPFSQVGYVRVHLSMASLLDSVVQVFERIEFRELGKV